ncbi:MAG: hypothetical protein FWF96_06535, partial [Kiritimatiellaeota bacterium]|nr:hypothetical protein [Kiritimatiellota bacterium]
MQMASTLNAFADRSHYYASLARDALILEFARRDADALAQQVNATLTPENIALVKKFPSPESARALANIEKAKALQAADPSAAADLCRDALADLAAALASAHRAKYNAELDKLQNFANRAFDSHTPLLAVVPLRSLAKHRPGDAEILRQLGHAEAALTAHLEKYFLLRHNVAQTFLSVDREAEDRKKTTAAIAEAAKSKEPLCLAALALTKDPPDLNAVKPLLTILEKHAADHNPAACYVLGFYHEATSPDKAHAFYWDAFLHGFLPANLPVALKILSGNFAPDLIERASHDLKINFDPAALLTPAAKAGCPAAQRELALLHLKDRSAEPFAALYFHGRGTVPDPALAHHWFAQAANRGDVQAQVNLGLLLLDGVGAAQSADAALYWLNNAAKQDDPVAKYNLGLLALRRVPASATPADAARYLRQSAEAGCAPAQRYLAGFCHDGILGFPKDPAQAFQWAQKSAAQNDPAGLLFLGLLHNKGIGTPVNFALAAEAIIKSANLGCPEAMHAAGLLYTDGEGVPQDFAKARAWFTRAADAGYAPAREWLEETP